MASSSMMASSQNEGNGGNDHLALHNNMDAVDSLQRLKQASFLAAVSAKLESSRRRGDSGKNSDPDYVDDGDGSSSSSGEGPPSSASRNKRKRATAASSSSTSTIALPNNSSARYSASEGLFDLSNAARSSSQSHRSLLRDSDSMFSPPSPFSPAHSPPDSPRHSMSMSNAAMQPMTPSSASIAAARSMSASNNLHLIADGSTALKPLPPLTSFFSSVNSGKLPQIFAQDGQPLVYNGGSIFGDDDASSSSSRKQRLHDQQLHREKIGKYVPFHNSSSTDSMIDPSGGRYLTHSQMDRDSPFGDSRHDLDRDNDYSGDEGSSDEDDDEPRKQKPPTRTGRKRLEHNRSERRRKQALKMRLNMLRDIVPRHRGKKTHLGILEGALDYIHELKDENANLRMENQRLVAALRMNHHGVASSTDPQASSKQTYVSTASLLGESSSHRDDHLLYDEGNPAPTKRSRSTKDREKDRERDYEREKSSSRQPRRQSGSDRNFEGVKLAYPNPALYMPPQQIPKQHTPLVSSYAHYDARLAQHQQQSHQQHQHHSHQHQQPSQQQHQHQHHDNHMHPRSSREPGQSGGSSYTQPLFSQESQQHSTHTHEPIHHRAVPNPAQPAAVQQQPQDYYSHHQHQQAHHNQPVTQQPRQVAQQQLAQPPALSSLLSAFPPVNNAQSQQSRVGASRS